MTFADGWVCQACWKPNRPRDTRCYRCRTERGADQAAVEASRRRQRVEAARQERVPGIVTVLPASVFAWYGRLVVGSGVLFVFLTPIILSNPRTPDNALGIWIAIAVGTLVAGIAMRWASGAMRASNPWAFAIALVLSLGLVAFTLWALGAMAPNVGNPVWMRWAMIIVFGISAILALVGLLFSLTDDPTEESSSTS